MTNELRAWNKVLGELHISDVPRKREQKLIDIMFQVAMVVRERHSDFKDDEELAGWVRKQLRECGFPTKPIGASWGVLDKER